MKDKIEESTKFDERKKVLVHRSKENKSNDLGDLEVITTAEIHEEGIKKTVSDLNKRKKELQKNIKSFEEVLAPAPKMNAELEELKQKLKILQLIAHKEAATEESVKKEQENLENCKKDLERVEKDLKEIKEAIGTRMKF